MTSSVSDGSSLSLFLSPFLRAGNVSVGGDDAFSRPAAGRWRWFPINRKAGPATAVGGAAPGPASAKSLQQERNRSWKLKPSQAFGAGRRRESCADNGRTNSSRWYWAKTISVAFHRNYQVCVTRWCVYWTTSIKVTNLKI